MFFKSGSYPGKAALIQTGLTKDTRIFEKSLICLTQTSKSIKNLTDKTKLKTGKITSHITYENSVL